MNSRLCEKAGCSSLRPEREGEQKLVRDEGIRRIAQERSIRKESGETTKPVQCTCLFFCKFGLKQQKA